VDQFDCELRSDRRLQLVQQAQPVGPGGTKLSGHDWTGRSGQIPASTSSARTSSTPRWTYVSLVVNDRAMGQHLRDDLDRDTGPDQLGRSGMPQHVRAELDPGPGPQPRHELGDRVVPHGSPDRCREQVDEDVVAVQVAVLGVHVLAVQAHQRRRNRQRGNRSGLGPGAVGVVLTRHDPQLATTRNEVAVAQPERLTHPDPGLCQQREQEPVPQPRAGGEDHRDLLHGQRGRQPPRCLELDRSGRDRAALGDMVQERLERPPRHSAPSNQRLSQGHTRAGVEVIEAKHARQVTVDRGLAAAGRRGIQHDHVRRRCPQPGHEPRDILDAGAGPVDAPESEELEPQRQTQVSGRGELHPPALVEPGVRVSPHRAPTRPTWGARDQVPVGEELGLMLANSIKPCRLFTDEGVGGGASVTG